MKRLLALLLLLSSAALNAQQLDWTNAVNVPNTIVNPSMDNCVTGSPTCGAWKETGFPLGDWVGANSNGGALNPGGKQYTFSYLSGTLYQDIDLSVYETNLFNFTFVFDLNNSCRNFIGGACDRIDGPIDPFSVTLKFYDTNGLNNSFTFLSGNPSTATTGCIGGVELLGLCLLGQNVQDNWQTFGWYSHVQSSGLFTSARLEFTGNDAGFWGGLYGPSIDNPMLQINYMPPPLPTSGGLAGMNVSAPGSDYIFIYKGNDPILFSQLAIKGEDLVGWTAVSSGGEALAITSIQRPDSDYLFLYTEGNPTSGTFYSFQEQPPTVDCVLSPFDPTCVIDTLGIDDGTVDYSDPQQVLASLEEDPAIETGADDGTDDGSDDGTEVVEDEEEILVADETPAEETNLEKMLQEEEADEEEEEKVVVADNVVTETVSPAEQVTAAYRELTDEEKAAILADAISKNTLEGALAIASEATSAASNAGGSTTVVTDSSSTKTTSTISSSESTVVAQDTSSGPLNVEESKQDSSSSSTDGTDILETGRQMGAAALATILADSASSASDSVAQAESIAAVSAETSFTSADVTEVRTDTVAAEISVEVEFSSATNDAGNVIEENNSMILMATNESSTTTEQADTFVEIMQLEIKPETGEIKDKDLEFVQQILATTEQKQSDDLSNSTFSEEEKVTIASDPALANAFNLAPNINNLEAAGVLNQKQEEKSDAEKRADEVVAANAKEQEDINKNYMDADQSGIVAAMGADTDVSAYRTAMLRDNNNWYKPEDIYKGIIIKDNVRGSYFLEKGNTDTYKKMVDEQYK